MATEQLTTAKLKSITEQDIGTILNDGGGLRGRVRKNRAGQIYIYFEYKYREGTKSRTAKVEHWPQKSLSEIRAVYREMKTSLVKGADPIEARQIEKLETQLKQAKSIENQKAELARLAAEAATRRTFSDSITQWEKRELSKRKDNGKEAMRAINKDIIPTLGEIALIDVKRAMIVNILDEVVERGSNVMANHLFGDLKQFFNYAIDREWVEAHPLAGLSKAKVGGSQNERDRYLSEAEIKELKNKLADAKLLKATECSIWIMLATCCRVGELSQARWEHIDLDAGQWTIPAGNSKNAKEHTIYLSEFALAQFKALQPYSGQSEWCYPGRDTSTHIGLKSIAKQIKDRARTTPVKGRPQNNCTALLLKGGGWTPHDLRRTGATLMGELGVTGEVIERCLNHVEQNKLKRIYQRHELKEEQKEAWQILGQRLSLLYHHQENNNIVLLNSTQNKA